MYVYEMRLLTEITAELIPCAALRIRILGPFLER